MSLSKSASANIFLAATSTIIILMAIAISTVVLSQSEKSFSQVITVGPVWTTNTWVCTSNSEYIVHGVLISYGDSPSELRIQISGLGIQPDFEFTPLKMESFSLGAPADSAMTLTGIGIITGYLTLQTMADAEASCIPV